jgi:hypothetical protein
VHRGFRLSPHLSYSEGDDEELDEELAQLSLEYGNPQKADSVDKKSSQKSDSIDKKSSLKSDSTDKSS